MAKKKYSFFIGRFQPLHAGHLALFDKVRKEGKYIAVGIQDTEIDENNPYTFLERVEMFKFLAPYIEVYKVPAIKEVCFSRDVGWGVREIRLDSETEKISGTEIRAKNKYYDREPTLGDELC